MEAGNCTCIKLVKVLLEKLQNDLFKVIIRALDNCLLQVELIAAKVLPSDYDFEAHKELVPMQAGDVPVTFADTTPLEQDFGFRPSTPLRDGLRAFAQWYAKYYGTCE